MAAAELPDEFIFVSEAIWRLGGGMHGGLRCPKVISDLKSAYSSFLRGTAPDWEPRKQRAAASLRSEIISGRLILYCYSPIASVASEVPIDVAKRIIAHRDRIPDRGARLTRSTPDEQHRVERLIACGGLLCVKGADFYDLYNRLRAQKRWWSQSGSINRQPRRGRPRLEDGGLSNLVQQLVNAGTWTGKMGIPALRRCLRAGGRILRVPSEDTVSRVVKDMLLKSGDPALRAPTRRRKIASAKRAR